MLRRDRQDSRLRSSVRHILSQAIRLIPSVLLKVSKFDIKAFFRNHGKQHADVYQSGRLTLSGFGIDYCVNFGERDAPDHTGRGSNAVRFFILCEWKRLMREYPVVLQELLIWLEHRRALRGRLAPTLTEEEDFLYAVVYFLFLYVDDAGMVVVDDPLVKKMAAPSCCSRCRTTVPTHAASKGVLSSSMPQRSALSSSCAMEHPRISASTHAEP